MTDRADDLARRVFESCIHGVSDYDGNYGPCLPCVAAALRAYADEAGREERQTLTAMIDAIIRKRNVLGFDICDFCGDDDVRWPDHVAECEFGQLLAAIRVRGETA